jgi:hypothetical protein
VRDLLALDLDVGAMLPADDVSYGAKLDVKNKRGLTPWRIAEGAVFEDAVPAQPQTAALLRRLMEERRLNVE